MDGGILAGLGGLLALLAVALLPMLTVDESTATVAGWQLWSGLLTALLALATTGVAWRAWRRPARRWGVALTGLAAVQGAVLAWTWGHIWTLVPCARLGLGACDPATGGLVDGTLVTFEAGAVAIVAAAVLTCVGGVLILAAPRQFAGTERFLRVLLSWDGQVVAERVFFHPVRVTIGESDHDTFQLPSSGLQRHVLLTPQADGRYLLDVPRTAAGKVTVGGHEREAADLALARVQPGDLGRLAFENGVEVAFTFTGAETARLPSALLAGGDRGVLVSFCAVAALLLMFLGGMLSRAHAHRREMTEDLARREPATIAFQLEPEPLPPEPPPPTSPDRPVAPAPREVATEYVRTPPSMSVLPKPRPHASTDPRDAGLPKVLAQAAQGSGAAARIFAGDDGVLTRKMEQISDGTGGDEGDGAGSLPGSGNRLGFRDGGSGGPGERGPYRVGGGGPLVRGPVGRDLVAGTGRKPRKPISSRPLGGEPNAPAGCDKGDIAKNVRSRASSIRSCYETQLLNRPDLSGKLTVQWTIAADGGVAEAHTTTDSIGSPAVTDCVLRAMRHLRFQAPERGICVVSWPFAFSAGN